MSKVCPELNGIAEPGCGKATGKSPSWMCTDHITSPLGELIHIAGAHDCICAVQSEAGWFKEYAVSRARLAHWKDVLEDLESDPKFSGPPPTDEEVQSAADRTLQLLKEMTQ